jgi:hypothetical protein
MEAADDARAGGLPGKLMDLGISSRELPGGLHVCYLFGDDDERFQLVARFFEAGKRAGDKLMYLVDRRAPTEIHQRMQQLSAELQAPGSCVVTGTDEAFYPEGTFSADVMLGRVGELLDQSIQEGFRGTRITGEMSWILRGVGGSERVMEFESRVTSVLRAHPHAAGICQYDITLFSGATLMDVLAVHPYTIVRGQFVENPFFVEPAEYLRSQTPPRLPLPGHAPTRP